MWNVTYYCYAECHYAVSFLLHSNSECHFCRMPLFMVMICAIMANVIVVNVVMLNAVYAECHFFTVMLSIIMWYHFG